MLLAVLTIDPVFFEQSLHLDRPVVRIQVRRFAHAPARHPVGAFVLVNI